MSQPTISRRPSAPVRVPAVITPWFWAVKALTTAMGEAASDYMVKAFGPVPAVLAVIFYVWDRSEHTLSILSIFNARRELFYWATVLATFALGTALGDLTAITFKLGYFDSGVLFFIVIAVPALAYRVRALGSVAAFWSAYVVTRPLGASFADYLSKPKLISGLNWGDAPVALALAAVIAVLVAYLAVTRVDMPEAPGAPTGPAVRSQRA